MNSYIPPDPRDPEAPCLVRVYPHGQRPGPTFFMSPADHQVFAVVVELDGPKVWLKECDRRGGFRPGGASYPASVRLIMSDRRVA